jgi:hypothetical protein
LLAHPGVEHAIFRNGTIRAAADESDGCRGEKFADTVFFVHATGCSIARQVTHAVGRLREKRFFRVAQGDESPARADGRVI